MNVIFKFLFYICIIFCIVIGLSLTVILFIEADFRDVYPTRNFAEAGPFGDYIGGVIGTIFSIAGIFLLFLNFNEQRRTFERERLETHFYERIKTYRENLYELSFTRKKETNFSVWDKLFFKHKEESSTHSGRKVFKIIYYDFIALYEEINFLFVNSKESDIYLSEYQEWLKKNPIINNRKVDLVQLAKIDITYCMIFTGLGSEERVTLTSVFSKRYKKTFTNKIIAFAALKPVEHSAYYPLWLELFKSPLSKAEKFDTAYALINSNESLTKTGHLKIFVELCQRSNLYLAPNLIKNSYYKYYGGHQFRLGHYFRHLYNTINFIDNRKDLIYNEKKSYVLTLRSQLSSYEQILFFLNSLSAYGRIWEYEDESDKEYIKFQKQLITKYNLIRNISTIRLAGDIDFSKYYPNVLFEGRYKSSNKDVRKKIERIYKYPILGFFYMSKFK